MKVVLDTNALLVSITPKSLYYPLFESFLEEQYALCVTTDILLEYEEILDQHVGSELCDVILRIIDNAPNTVLIDRYYEWELITADTDDNKFVDCAVAANAKFIVTEDKHFRVLEQIDFPKVDTIGIERFIETELKKPLNF